MCIKSTYRIAKNIHISPHSRQKWFHKNISFLLHITPYNLVGIQRWFRGITQQAWFSVWDSTLVFCEDERRNSSKTSANFYRNIRHHITKTVIITDAVVWNFCSLCNCVFNIMPETLQWVNEGPRLRAAGYILQKTQEKLECQFVLLWTESELTALSLQIIRIGVSDYKLHSVPYNNTIILFFKTICPLTNYQTWRLRL